MDDDGSRVPVPPAVEADEGMLRAAVDALSDGFFVCRPDGRLSYANRAVSDQTGRSHDTLVGCHFRELFGGPQLELVESAHQRLLSGQLQSAELTLASGVRCEVTAGPIFDGHRRVVALYGVARDVSRRWRVEQELRQSRVELAARTAAFEAEVLERRRLDRANRQHAREQLCMVQVAAALRGARSRAEMLPVILDQLGKLLAAEGALFAMVDPTNGGVAVELASGAWSAATGRRLVALDGLDGGPGRGGRSSSCERAGDLPWSGCEDLAAAVRTVARVPLTAADTTIGVLWMGREAELSEEDARLLQAVAEMSAAAIHRATLFEETQRSNLELAAAYDTTLEGWSRALELRDRETEGHTKRVSEMAVALAGQMGLDGEESVQVRRGALLHDIGKMAIPDRILLKPGPLNDDEWRVMRRHPTYARELLEPIAFLRPALDIPWCHHERWDGRGYPRGLRGEEIPLAARAFAVIDVWDALRSERPYREAWTARRALEYIRGGAAAHFDPLAVEAFLDLLPALP